MLIGPEAAPPCYGAPHASRTISGCFAAILSRVRAAPLGWIEATVELALTRPDLAPRAREILRAALGD